MDNLNKPLQNNKFIKDLIWPPVYVTRTMIDRCLTHGVIREENGKYYYGSHEVIENKLLPEDRP
jgi:hypothetical protein